MKNLNIRKVTLTDIAEHCGVSIATASKVLSKREGTFISEGTRNKIFEAAKELGYRVNFGTKLIQAKATGLIGIAFSRKRVAEEEHARDLLFILISKLKKLGKMTHVVELSETEGVEDFLEMMNVGCESFIIFGSPTESESVKQALRVNQKPYIAFQSALLDRNVESDTAAGVAEILKHWMSLGKNDFKVLVPDVAYLGVDGNRMEGLRRVFPNVSDKALMERYISLLPGYEGKLAEEVFQIAYQATHLLLQSEKKLQAILYFTDQAALGGIKALLEMKLVPGKDIAVAGINDSNASKYGAYPFTSMQHNLETIADKLIENIDAVGPLKLYMSPVVHFRD